ncbi:alpha/beta fold hydrolase [Musicola keenii]|uniref:alpha/beta fold hydrolase n=1 Tax=Musicola keenii TaxID=2884250 RepID=UPI00177EBB66|nr:alpha/beta fold hydrolase [Musicola keenii]
MKTILDIDALNRCYACQPFSIATSDNAAHLNGQINTPPASVSRPPLVILYPGSGLHDRHALLGESNTASDYLFHTLAHYFLEAGFAVMRADCRGVGGNHRSAELDRPEYRYNRQQAFHQRFVDTPARLSVTPQTQYEDAAALYRFAAALDTVDTDNILLLGHSEGAVNIGRMLDRYQLSPRGVLLMSPPLTPLRDTMRWQMAERCTQWLNDIPHNGETITLEELKNGFGHSPLSSLYPISTWLPYHGAWTQDDLQQARAQSLAAFEQEADRLATLPDDMPWPNAHAVHASHAWWKQFFAHGAPIVSHFLGYAGPVSCFFGDVDTQLDYRAQLAILQQYRSALPNWTTQVYQGLGHSLGIHGLLGPISDNAAHQLVTAARDMLAV